jgi:FkbM family methyltransferase
MSPFVSYAQNFEDVVLWRALRHIEKGFYVDVGAQDPEIDSVTRAFYERGWSGINIEPVEEYFIRLNQARPHDSNLRIAVGGMSGLRTLHSFAGSGLSTLDPQISARHEAAGLTPTESMVQVLTLTEVLKDSGRSLFHFLKIDVEGAEGEVLEGLDLDRIRPWIIVVEATEPNSTTTNHEKWEHLVTDHGYSFAYFDGLNRFYVANEVSELKEQLAVPPNFFDNFVRASEWAYKQKAETLEKDLMTVHKHLTSVQQDLLSVQQDLLSVQQDRLSVQAQLDGVRAELAAEREQRNYLLGRVHQLQAQLAVPSIDRFVGRVLSRMRDRLTQRKSQP